MESLDVATLALHRSMVTIVVAVVAIKYALVNLQMLSELESVHYSIGGD